MGGGEGLGVGEMIWDVVCGHVVRAEVEKPFGGAEEGVGGEIDGRVAELAGGAA